jgi:hypothetical protein
VRDIARYQPDLLVVYLGHNEAGTRYSANERRWIDPRGFAWRAWLVDTRLYTALSRMMPVRAASHLIDLQSVHRPGTVDASFRPNQILAVGGLPLRLIEHNRACLIVEAVKDHLWTPLGLRSLAPGESDRRLGCEGETAVDRFVMATLLARDLRWDSSVGRPERRPHRFAGSESSTTFSGHVAPQGEGR